MHGERSWTWFRHRYPQIWVNRKSLFHPKSQYPNIPQPQQWQVIVGLGFSKTAPSWREDQVAGTQRVRCFSSRENLQRRRIRKRGAKLIIDESWDTHTIYIYNIIYIVYKYIYIYIYIYIFMLCVCIMYVYCNSIMDKCLKAIEWEKWKLVDDKWDEGNISSHLTLPPKWFQIYIPDAPCMEYVWVFTKKKQM